MQVTLFTIPIYFRSLENHYKWRDGKKDNYIKHLENFANKYSLKKVKLDPEFRNQLETIFPGSDLTWKYTQIIGMIEIRYEYNSFKGYLYKVKSKRYSHTMNKKYFKYCGKLGDVSRRGTNQMIVKNILRYLENCKNNQTRIFKNRFVDTEVVENLLPLIDFQKL